MEEIEFNKARYDQFVRAYKTAVKKKQQSFTCFGKEWLTDYAKYVIELLDPRFKHMK